MVENASKSEFERLLQERAQIEQWLERLSASGEKTPESVRVRVQSDYQKRLDEVQEELNGHRDEISGTLDRHRSVRDGLLEQQADAEEKRAEAELRHSVGEFDDAKWEGIREEIDGSLNKLGEELAGVDAEVAELEKALASLTPDADEKNNTENPPQPAASPELAIEQPAPKVDDLPPPIRVSQPAVKAVTAEVEPVTASRNDEPDEALKFLDVDGGTEENVEATPAATAEPMPPDAAELLGQTEDTGDSGIRSAVGADDVTSFSESTDQPKKGAAKTLKCGECGAMNLPTEWYCERCGAELAAL